MKPPVQVGQRVKLNSYGMKMIHGIQSEEEYRQSQDMTITKVSQMGPDLWTIEVDAPLINRFMLTSEFVGAI